MNKGKYIRRIIYLIPVVSAGIFMFVYGEYDDSPGGQLIGLLVVIMGITGMVKAKRRISHRK